MIPEAGGVLVWPDSSGIHSYMVMLGENTYTGDNDLLGMGGSQRDGRLRTGLAASLSLHCAQDTAGSEVCSVGVVVVPFSHSPSAAAGHWYSTPWLPWCLLVNVRVKSNRVPTQGGEVYAC